MPERKLFLAGNLLWWVALSAGAIYGQWWLSLILIILYPVLFNRSRSPYLPVLMYHSVNDDYRNFIYSFISVDTRTFRWMMSYLKWRRYKCLSAEEAEQFVQGKSFGSRIVYLTFDDGYLDNWVNAWPIMKANGQRGTIFVSRDFIDLDGSVRPVREPGSGPLVEDWGFMNMEEIKQARASGVFDFFPHGRTHTWYESSDRLTGFHLPGDQMAWLDWNRFPERKPDWITRFPQSITPAGWPVLEHRKSLESRRFILDDDLVARFVSELPDDVARIGFPGLEECWRKFSAEHPVIGRAETDEEMRGRFLDELLSTRELLKEHLGIDAFLFCWPGGGQHELSVELAYGEASYRLSTVRQTATPNRRGSGSRWLYRVGAGNSLLFENPVYNLLRFVSHVETYRRNYSLILLFAFFEIVEKAARIAGRRRRKGDNRSPHIGIEI